jgi:hypothetical protein
MRRWCAVVVLGVLLLLSVGPAPSPSGGVLGTVTSSGGVVLDGYGGLHPFGGVSLDTTGSPYWPGWDIARSVAVLADGTGGWTLDGYGGIHAWGTAPALSGGPYWPGWDIARALYVTPDGEGGYVLDGYGGIHAVGTAPPLTGAPYWADWDIARGLDIHLDAAGVPDGGWVLDGYGGIRAFGSAPPLPQGRYTPGFDVFESLHVVPGGAYEVTRFGDVEIAGSPAGISWTGYPSWGSWDIVRDVVPLNASLAPAASPVDRGVAAGLMERFMSIDRTARGLSALGGNATLEAIAGNGDGYDLGNSPCNGVASTIGDRTSDMYARNYFSHVIPGCATTQYVFSTYLEEYGISFRQAGENVAWRVGDYSLIDDVAAINQMWLASPDHYANIVGPYSSVGCGLHHTALGSYQGASGPAWVWACEFLG